MDKLSKEELLALINTNKPKKERKKADLTEEKKLAMLDRLADMRATVKKNRDAKKTVDPIIKEKELEAIFEKKYASQFDKMNALLTDLNESTKEVAKIKREKLAKKEVETKIELKVEPKVEAKVEPSLETPKQIPPPTPQPILIPARPINPNIHRKGTTRW